MKFCVRHCSYPAKTNSFSVFDESSAFFSMLLWPPYGIGQAVHYIVALWFLSIFLSFFFPRLISAAADWMFTILRHMMWL